MAKLGHHFFKNLKQIIVLFKINVAFLLIMIIKIKGTMISIIFADIVNVSVRIEIIPIN